MTADDLRRAAEAHMTVADWRVKAHAAFDPLWKRNGRRSEAYAWLAQSMGLARADCHIRLFDAEQCKRVVTLCEKRMGLL